MKFFNHIKKNKGMTYVELIVVLSIFSLMTSIVLFNYKGFQAKVDIKVLANDIALKIVEAQKSAISGKWNIYAENPNTWKPSYGLYFDLKNSIGGDNKHFIYFVDLDQSKEYQDNNGLFCSSSGSASGVECLNKIDITKGNFISKIERYTGGTGTEIIKPLSITFKRPDSSAVFFSGVSVLSGFDYIQITISSSGSNTSEAYIKVYPSGRIQID